MSGRLILGILLFAAVSVRAEETLFDFAGSFDKSRVKAVDCSVRKAGKLLEINIPANKVAELRFAPEGDVFDFSKYIYLTLDFQNGKDAAEFRVNTSNPRENWEHIGWLKPNERRVFDCLLLRHSKDRADYPHAKDFPGMHGIPDGLMLHWKGVDAKHIKNVLLTMEPAEKSRTLYLRSLKLRRDVVPAKYAEDPKAFFPFIDQYGQYKHGDWPGRITSDDQLNARIVPELADLKAHPGSGEWNRFGGWKQGPKLKATGHFRTEKIDGRWWMVDPEGCLFWSHGVNSVGKGLVPTPFKEREHFFEWLPERDSEFGKFYGSKTEFRYGEANLYRKYGENFRDTYNKLSLVRMKSWGLNTLGGWPNTDLYEMPEDLKLPYTVIVSPKCPQLNEKFPDPYSPQFRESLRSQLGQYSPVVASDPFCIGFFVNNEIDWNKPMGFVGKVLEQEAWCHAKKAFVQSLEKDFPTIGKLNSAWGTDYASWDALLKARKHSHDYKKTIGDYKKFYAALCDQYFRVCREEIDRAAPGKLYLGCRFHGNHKNEFNLVAAGKYVDILSYNVYMNEPEVQMFGVDKPLILTEFNFGALDRGKFFCGLGVAADQRNRGEKYQNYMRVALENPNCVGAHWFMWNNSTTAGRGNGENANCGLIDVADNVFTELIAYFRETGYSLYGQLQVHE
ncbi:MAG: beta-galactosidase [Kiritimatiellales bacterium]|nr:beta-galactosidase [Kiritimatiellales bacterium]